MNLNTSMGITCLYDVLKAPVNDVTKRGLLASFDQVLSLSLLDKAAAVREEQKKQKTASQGDYTITGEGDPAVDAQVMARYEAKKGQKLRRGRPNPGRAQAAGHRGYRRTWRSNLEKAIKK